MKRRTAFLWVVFCLAAWFLLAATGPMAPVAQSTPTPAANQPTYIYLFWGDGCPHCAAAEPFLEELTQRYPNVELRAYEVWYVRENQQVFTDMAAAFGFQPQGVPTIFIGERYWVGFSEHSGQDIEAVVSACVQNGCKDAGAGIVPQPAVEDPPATEQPTLTPLAQVTSLPVNQPSLTPLPPPALTRGCAGSAALALAALALLLQRWLR